MFAADLAVATAIIGSLSCLAFLAGRKVRPSCKGIFVSTIFVGATFSLWFHGSLGWANIVPLSSAVLLSNLTPVVVAFIAGYACNGLNIRPHSRPLAVSGLSLIAVVCLMAPLIRPVFAPPELDPAGTVKGKVVMQSHESTCAPASAATLLRLHGIESSEKEMVSLCLTSEFGTEALGLYRGIKLGIENQNHTARIAGPNPYRWAAEGQLPNVALVRFPQEEFSEAVSTSQLRQIRLAASLPNRFSGVRRAEEGHAVVLIDYKDHVWTVADPAVGLVTWSDAEFRNRFTGDAIYIANRQSPEPE